MNAPKLAVVIAAIALAIAACSQTATKPQNVNKAAVVATPGAAEKPVDVLATGQELYVTNCQICHRDSGKGGKVTVEGKKLNPADLTSDKRKTWNDARFFKEINEGMPEDGMPAFKDKLSEEQIKQIVQYIRKLQGGPGGMATS